MEVHFNASLYGSIADTYNWGILFPFHWPLSPLFPLQVKELNSGDGDGGFKRLSTSIGTKKGTMSKAATTTISDKLTKEEVRRCTLVDVCVSD